MPDINVNINFAEIWGKIVAFWTDAVSSAETYLEGLFNIDITKEFLLFTDISLLVLIGFIVLVVITWKKIF